MKILCVGLMICDIALSPVPRNIFEMDQWDIDPPSVTGGGDAYNVAVALSKLGETAAVIGRTGDDANGRFLKAEGVRQGVDMGHVIMDRDHHTAVSYILIEENGERHFLCDSHINDVLCIGDIPDASIQQADAVFFGSALAMRGMDQGGLCELFHRAKTYGKVTALDASITQDASAEIQMERLEQTLTATDIFIPSYGEACYLTGETDLFKISDRFRHFNLKVFGIKLGSKGCFLTDFKKQCRIGCFNFLPVVDTTGAGDCFMGGFLKAYLNGADLQMSGLFASAAAAFGVSAAGATEGIPSELEVNKLVAAAGHNVNIKSALYGGQRLC